MADAAEAGRTKQILIGIAGVAVAASFMATLYLASDILIVLFLAVLFAIFLSKLSHVGCRWFRVSYKVSLAIVVTTLIIVSLGAVVLFGQRIKSELAAATEHIDEARSDLRQRLNESPAFQAILEQTPVVKKWVRPILARPPAQQDSNGSARAESANSKDVTRNVASDAIKQDGSQNDVSRQDLSQAFGAVRSVAGGFLRAFGEAVSTTFGLALNSLIILFVGLFLAVTPEDSQQGVICLAPPKYRGETQRVMKCLGDSLWRWLVGRFASMAATGLGIGVALSILGVPMAMSLGIVTGLLTFIPNIGAAIALGLAMFLALPAGLSTVGWVVVAYLVFQLIESYALTPLIQQYQVSIPPAILISVQAILGSLLGFLGALIASPVLVVILVMNREVYQKFWAEDRS